MERLPDEMVVHIVSFLPQDQLTSLSLVSRRWKRLCYDPLLWRGIDFRHCKFHKCGGATSILEQLPKVIDTKCVKRITLEGKYADKHGHHWKNDQALELVMKHFSHIEVLGLFNFTAIKKHDELWWVRLNEATWTLSSLQELALYVNDLVDDEKCEMIATCCSQLIRLDLLYCYQVTDYGVAHFAEKCQRLAYLLICCCDRLSVEVGTFIGKHCRNLETFMIEIEDKVTDHVLVRVIQNNPKLKTLRLVNGNITDNSCASIAQFCPNLETLIFKECQRVTDRGLFLLTDCCGLLQTLELDGTRKCTDVGIYSVVHRWQDMTSIRLYQNDCVTDDVLRCFARSLSQLRSLDVKKCARVTHKGFLTVIRKCTKLEYLISTNNPSVGLESEDETVDGEMDDGYASSSLKHLELYKCKKLNDHCICLMTRMCPKLQWLILDHCPLTDNAIHFISKHCLLLRILSVIKCKLLSGKSLEYLLTGCRWLKGLACKDCSGIKTSDITWFQERAERCRFISFYDCWKEG